MLLDFAADDNFVSKEVVIFHFAEDFGHCQRLLSQKGRRKETLEEEKKHWKKRTKKAKEAEKYQIKKKT